MKTIAIMNNKGGVGKTVTAINLADILIQDYRKRVLLADCDGQMNLTRFFLPEYDPEVGYSMVSLLLGDGEPVWSDNVVPLRPGLNLVPGSLELYSLDLAAMSEGEDVRQTQRMLDFAEAVRQDEEVDYLIFDCPPGFTAASMAALRAADEVVIPMELDGFSIYGLSTLAEQLANLRRRGAKARVAGVLITKKRNTEFSRSLEILVRGSGIHVFETAIRYTAKLPESTADSRPLSEYSFRSAAAVDYRRWVRAMEQAVREATAPVRMVATSDTRHRPNIVVAIRPR